MANYAQTVNVIGCIKTNKTSAAFATTGLPLMLYRKHFGIIPIKVEAAAPYDVVAALGDDGKTLTIGIVNPTMKAADLPLKLNGITLAGGGRQWQIAGNDRMLFNEPGKTPQVAVDENSVEGVLETLAVPPCSVTLYALPLK